jgi:hypothetical protein
MIAFAVAIAVPLACRAQTVRWKQYLHPESPKFEEYNQLYLAGVKDGLIAYSVFAKDKLFCLPDKLVLSNEQAEDIMKGWAAKQTRNLDDVPIGAILLKGLGEIFPCH